ncbi:MAG: hypothetical protein N2C14_22170 [Planctomycetales bacterium]
MSKTDNFKVKHRGQTPPPQTEIRALKFYDFNGDGAQGDPADEPSLPNWRMELRRQSDGALVSCQLTDGGGEAVFLVEQDGTAYVVSEVLVGDYINTTPLEVEVAAEFPTADVVFGNVCLIPVEGLGRTPGFWQACNNGEGIVGCNLLLACDPDWRVLLNDLCLATPDGQAVNIPLLADFENGDGTGAFYVFGDWIVGTGAEGNMAYILSKQLAAISLNRECGFLADSAVVFIDCGGEKKNLDEIIADAKSDGGVLCQYPLTPGDSLDPAVIAARAAQEELKNCIDAVNNNLTPVYVVSPTPCPYEIPSYDPGL